MKGYMTLGNSKIEVDDVRDNLRNLNEYWVALVVGDRNRKPVYFHKDTWTFEDQTASTLDQYLAFPNGTRFTTEGNFFTWTKISDEWVACVHTSHPDEEPSVNKSVRIFTAESHQKLEVIE